MNIGILKLLDAFVACRPVLRVLVGLAEVTSAVLLLHPRTAPVGAVGIIIVMLGAMGTHIAVHHADQITNEVFPLVLATLVLIGRILTPARFARP